MTDDFMMHLTLTRFFFWATLFCVVLEAADVRMPPTIVKGPAKDSHDYRDDDEYVLDCIATGTPSPEYEWLRNNKLMPNSGGRILDQGNGTIKLIQLGILDEGSYQCKASNQYGIALSRKTVMRRAVLAQYPAKMIYEAPPVQEGTRYTLQCQMTKWYPKPIFSWTVVANPEDESETPITPDQRIQIDEDGNLHFSYLLPSDSQNNRLYKCKLFNNVLDVTIGGSYSRLQVTPVASVEPFAPVKMFSTKSPLVGLEKQQITMKCFFSGKPDPRISWSKDGGSLPLGRYINQYSRSGEIIIKDLQPSDSGTYRCTAQNTQSQNVSEVVEVRIEAFPVFQNSSNKPSNVNVTEGSNVTIHCKAYAKPTAKVQWFRNGDQLDLVNLPRKFRLSPDMETLTIFSLCKKCDDGSSDLMVIQCNASNTHGYAFADGYINVLEKTVITTPPENISLSIEDEKGEFVLDAKTDDSTPLIIQWYRIWDDGRELLHSDERHVRISDGGKRVSFDLPHNMSKRGYYNGLYLANASNSYSPDSALVYLVAEELPPPIPPVGPSVAGIAELWWIIVLVAGLFLLFLLLLLCCIYCYWNRGDVYPVDKKERKNGNDPEKELADSGFFDYKRPEPQPVKESRVSLNSSLSVSDEEASLNEYGNIDPGKFTEEGSFIGDYANGNSKKKHNHHSKV